MHCENFKLKFFFFVLRVVGIGALLTTAIACVLIFTQIVLDGLHNMKPVKRKVHGFYDFFVSFGTILFAFGGASTFPTIQNDMINKEKFSKSVFIAFSGKKLLFKFFFDFIRNNYI